jgi:(2Fe-2S) ferredoxin
LNGTSFFVVTSATPAPIAATTMAQAKSATTLKLNGQGKVRVNMAGCLDRCDEGPVMVIYPEEVWYTYVDQEDVDEIVQEHLVHGRVVERLKI